LISSIRRNIEAKYMSYRVQAPVATVLFNRPDKSRRVFEKIRAVKPAKIYLIADGPRPGNQRDAENCPKARSVFEAVDWDCQVLKNFSEANIGCGQRIFTGFSWVFQREERAILLEDDCVPDESFFPFCDELLEKYEKDSRVMMIAGSNIKGTWDSGKSYHFAKFGCIHGWATWKRAWEKVDMNLKLWNDPRTKELLKGKLGSWLFYFLGKNYDRLVDRGENAPYWDYQFDFARFVNNGLAVVPSVNLVTNIGFGPESTNTKDEKSRAANIPTSPLKFPMNHPSVIIEDRRYDKIVASVLFPKRPILILWRIKNEVVRVVKRMFRNRARQASR
jgi:hypothetical protein